MSNEAKAQRAVANIESGIKAQKENLKDFRNALAENAKTANYSALAGAVKGIAHTEGILDAYENAVAVLESFDLDVAVSTLISYLCSHNINGLSEDKLSCFNGEMFGINAAIRIINNA